MNAAALSDSSYTNKTIRKLVGFPLYQHFMKILKSYFWKVRRFIINISLLSLLHLQVGCFRIIFCANTYPSKFK